MQKIVLDTNVIVSALISNSYPKQILYDIVFDRKVANCISNEILEEYIEVLNREKFEKFSNFKNNAEVVINKLIEISIFYLPIEKITIISDFADNKFLEVAKESMADYLITGNFRDFSFDNFENTKIVSPKEFIETFGPL